MRFVRWPAGRLLIGGFCPLGALCRYASSDVAIPYWSGPNTEGASPNRLGDRYDGFGIAAGGRCRRRRLPADGLSGAGAFYC